jgi:hypothetical protein
MTIEQLKNLHKAEPFRPFTIYLADGRSLQVNHPELLTHSPGGRTLIVFHGGESFSILDLLLVTELRPLDSVPSNGQGNTQ